MLVELTDSRVPEQHTAAAIGLHSMLVRVNDNGIDAAQSIKGRAWPVTEDAGKAEISAVGSVSVHACAVALGEVENGGQVVDRRLVGNPAAVSS